MIKQIAILGLLMEGPKHGYEIKRIVDEVLSQVAKISTGSTYYTIKKLADDGFVSCETDREGSRPEKHVCHITERGKEEYRRLIHENLYTHERPYWDFNLSLFFLHDLDQNTLKAALEGKIARLERMAKYVMSINRLIVSKNYGYAGKFLTEHSLAHLKLDIRFYKQLLHELRMGTIQKIDKTFADYMMDPERPGLPEIPVPSALRFIPRTKGKAKK